MRENPQCLESEPAGLSASTTIFPGGTTWAVRTAFRTAAGTRSPGNAATRLTMNGWSGVPRIRATVPTLARDPRQTTTRSPESMPGAMLVPVTGTTRNRRRRTAMPARSALPANHVSSAGEFIVAGAF